VHGIAIITRIIIIIIILIIIFNNNDDALRFWKRPSRESRLFCMLTMRVTVNSCKAAQAIFSPSALEAVPLWEINLCNVAEAIGREPVTSSVASELVSHHSATVNRSIRLPSSPTPRIWTWNCMNPSSLVVIIIIITVKSGDDPRLVSCSTSCMPHSTLSLSTLHTRLQRTVTLSSSHHVSISWSRDVSSARNRLMRSEYVTVTSRRSYNEFRNNEASAPIDGEH